MSYDVNFRIEIIGAIPNTEADLCDIRKELIEKILAVAPEISIVNKYDSFGYEHDPKLVKEMSEYCKEARGAKKRIIRGSYE